MRRAVMIVLGVSAMSGCNSLPWVGAEAPDECEPVFAAGTRMEWVGRGDIRELGLDPFLTEPWEADIYIGRSAPTGVVEPAGSFAFCAVSEDGSVIGPVPEGWRAP